MEAISKLRVKCIKCGKEWEKDSLISWGPEDYSSSLCCRCFILVAAPLIHKKQLLEGNFDCFGKADSYCDQNECKYIKWCLNMEESRQSQNGPVFQGDRKSPSLGLCQAAQV